MLRNEFINKNDSFFIKFVNKNNIYFLKISKKFLTKILNSFLLMKIINILMFNSLTKLLFLIFYN